MTAANRFNDQSDLRLYETYGINHQFTTTSLVSDLVHLWPTLRLFISYKLLEHLSTTSAIIFVVFNFIHFRILNLFSKSFASLTNTFQHIMLHNSDCVACFQIQLPRYMCNLQLSVMFWRILYVNVTLDLIKKLSRPCQSKLARGIIFSTGPFVCPLSNLWTWYFEQDWTHFNANWHKCSPVQGHETFGVRRQKVKVTARQSEIRLAEASFSSFYRATRMHSADYAVARCLSVRLSVGIESKHILKVFSPSGSHTILVFPHQEGWHYSDGDPLTGVSNARGYEIITIFDQYLALFRKWCKIEP